MEENEVFDNIMKNLKELDIVEKDISMVRLAIYQKKIEKIKYAKIDEINNYFENESLYYHQKSNDFEQEIDKNVQKYKEQIDKLINVYDKLYVRAFRKMENSINNQKIAIANIITLSKKMKQEGISNEDKQNYRKTITACAQRKLNYSVIIDECKARLNWCVDNIQKDLDEVFVNKSTQLDLYNENAFTRFKEQLLNRLFGKKRFKRVLEEYETEYIKTIKNKNNSKVLGVIIVIEAVEKQFEDVKVQISSQYNEAVQN